MKILNGLYKLFKTKKNADENRKVSEFDNAYFRDERFKKNVLFSTIFLFLMLLFVMLYIFFRQNVVDKPESMEDEVLPPLRIVVPYPNNSINIDDYEILKYQIKSGDNLMSILTKEVGITASDANSVLAALGKVYNVSQLRVGQTVSVKYRILINQDKNGKIDEKVLLEELRLEPDDKETEVVVSHEKNGKYEARRNKITLNKNYLKYKVRINESLYMDGIEAGIPPSIMLDFIRFFSFDIDFQRDLRKGDVFEVLFESYSTDDGKKVKDGEILFASLDNQGRKFEMYRHNLGGGGVNYFNSNGQSVQKSLLKTPVNGARISSPYGVRKHPILGYSKLHSGKDFAAPTGTPIFAAGSGTITKAQFWSTWGNYIRIKHTGGYETEYAHASRIAPGIKPGVRVRQGQVIAYVGSTGRSTGPHVHYGVFYNGQRINPDRVKSLPSVKLIGKDLINFKKEVEKIDLYRLNIPNQNLRLKK